MRHRSSGSRVYRLGVNPSNPAGQKVCRAGSHRQPGMKCRFAQNRLPGLEHPDAIGNAAGFHVVTSCFDGVRTTVSLLCNRAVVVLETSVMSGNRALHRANEPGNHIHRHPPFRRFAALIGSRSFIGFILSPYADICKGDSEVTLVMDHLHAFPPCQRLSVMIRYEGYAWHPALFNFRAGSANGQKIEP